MNKRATGQSSFSDLAVSGLGGPKTAALLGALDATIIEQARGHKTGEKDDKGEDLTTRDPEASFTKKHDTTYHGYKMHTATDTSAIITGVVVSTASHHDSRHIDELIENEMQAVFADSAYSDAKRREDLEARKVLPAIIYKRKKGTEETVPVAEEVEPAGVARARDRRAPVRVDEAADELHPLPLLRTAPQHVRLRDDGGGVQPPPRGQPAVGQGKRRRFGAMTGGIPRAEPGRGEQKGQENGRNQPIS